MVQNFGMNNQEREDYISTYTRCVNFAAIKHKDQRRSDPEGTPYINHPIGMLLFVLLILLF